MQTDVTLELRFNALAALECPECDGTGTVIMPPKGPPDEPYLGAELPCTNCGGTGRRYPILSVSCEGDGDIFHPCHVTSRRPHGKWESGCMVPFTDYDYSTYKLSCRCHGTGRISLSLDTPANLQRAEGALMEITRPTEPDIIRVVYTHDGRTIITLAGYPDHIIRTGEGSNDLEALIATLEALEGEQDAP